jgi:hypothetical protein
VAANAAGLEQIDFYVFLAAAPDLQLITLHFLDVDDVDRKLYINFFKLRVSCLSGNKNLNNGT